MSNRSSDETAGGNGVGSAFSPSALREEHELAKRCSALLHRVATVRHIACRPGYAEGVMRELRDAEAATPRVPRSDDPFSAADGVPVEVNGLEATSWHSAVFDYTQRLWNTCHFPIDKGATVEHVPVNKRGGYIIRHTVEYDRAAPTDVPWDFETLAKLRTRLQPFERIQLVPDEVVVTYLCAEYQRAQARHRTAPVESRRPTERLTFDDASKTITLDGVAYPAIHETAYKMFSRIWELGVQKRTLVAFKDLGLGSARQDRLKRQLPRELAKLVRGRRGGGMTITLPPPPNA